MKHWRCMKCSADAWYNFCGKFFCAKCWDEFIEGKAI